MPRDTKKLRKQTDVGVESFNSVLVIKINVITENINNIKNNREYKKIYVF